MYNVLSSMFNALGKSRIPLYFLIFSSVFNIVLDWVFVADFALDVAGVAGDADRAGRFCVGVIYGSPEGTEETGRYF